MVTVNPNVMAASRMPGAAGKPDCAAEPDIRRCRQPLDFPIAAYDGSSAQKTDCGDDAFDHAQRVGGGIQTMLPQLVIELKSDQSHHRRAKGDKHVRAHARVVAPNLSIDPEQQTEDHRRPQPESHLARVDIHLKMHASPLSSFIGRAVGR
jgi:hypothetical protein